MTLANCTPPFSAKTHLTSNVLQLVGIIVFVWVGANHLADDERYVTIWYIQGAVMALLSLIALIISIMVHNNSGHDRLEGGAAVTIAQGALVCEAPDYILGATCQNHKAKTMRQLQGRVWSYMPGNKNAWEVWVDLQQGDVDNAQVYERALSRRELPLVIVQTQDLKVNQDIPVEVQNLDSGYPASQGMYSNEPTKNPEQAYARKSLILDSVIDGIITFAASVMIDSIKFKGDKVEQKNCGVSVCLVPRHPYHLRPFLPQRLYVPLRQSGPRVPTWRRMREGHKNGRCSGESITSWWCSPEGQPEQYGASEAPH